MIQVLKENRPECFLPFLRHALIVGRQDTILETLDQGKGVGQVGVSSGGASWSLLLQWLRRCLTN